MKFSQVKAILAERGVQIRKLVATGEYRVVRQGGSEESAYYTDWLDDAYLTGLQL